MIGNKPIKSIRPERKSKLMAQADIKTETLES